MEQKQPSKKLATSRKRNWLKARIVGGYIGGEQGVITVEERIILKEIERLRQTLIERWDNNSTELGMFVAPRKNKFREV